MEAAAFSVAAARFTGGRGALRAEFFACTLETFVFDGVEVGVGVTVDTAGTFGGSCGGASVVA